MPANHFRKSLAPNSISVPAESNRQALAAMFVDQVQHPYRPSVVRLRAHEVVRPDVVGVLWPQPYTQSVVEPQPPARLLLLGNLQPFATPGKLHSVLTNLPAIPLQQCRDTAVVAAPILVGQLLDGLGECIFVLALRQLVALHAA